MQLPPIQPVIACVLEAGALARAMQKQVMLSVKPDGTPITEADVSCHNLLVKSLTRLTPEIPVLSEEQPAAQNEAVLREKLFWAIDPIDVTANYAAGGNAYSVNVALVAEGVPVRGVLLFPGLDELYFTGDDGKAYKQVGKDAPRAIHVAPVHGGAQTAALRPDTHATHAPVPADTLKVIFTRGQRRACLVATGEATFCSEREGFRLWDSAPTYAIIHAAGGAVVMQDGGPVRYDRIHLPAYFVGHPELLRHLHAVSPGGEPREIPVQQRQKKA